MRLVVYLLAIICAIAAIIYITTQAGSLPTFMPGYAAGSARIHSTHALAAAIAAVVLLSSDGPSAARGRKLGAVALFDRTDGASYRLPLFFCASLRCTRSSKRETLMTIRLWVPPPIGSNSSCAATRKVMERP